MARKERVFRVQHDGAHAPLDSGIVDINMAISQDRFKPSRYFAMCLSASPVGDLAETCPRL